MPSPPAIRHGGNRACYWPAIDQISMPKRETFVSSEAYYGTLCFTNSVIQPVIPTA